MTAYARVAIVQRSLRRYRETFYSELRDQLGSSGIELALVHGNSPGLEERGDPGELPWAVNLQARRIGPGGRIVWQPAGRIARTADLVVVEQATQLLLNYLLLARQRLGGPKVALWGHGASFLPDRSSRAEAVKRWVSRLPHWWFAYNDAAAQIVRGIGFPADRITVVQNATDTRRLRSLIDAVDPPALERLRGDLGIQGANVGLFLGSLSPHKRFDFLAQAGDRIRRRVPDFELIIAGDGPEAPLVASLASERSWMRWVGPRFGGELAALLKASKLLLVPGWVGLVVVDSFAAEVPLVASGSSSHPPEIAYLQDGRNGMLVQDHGDPEHYAEAISALLTDESRRQELIEGCRLTAPDFSIEQMAARFRDGIQQALNS